ncbi:hypothetical protein [Hyphomonas sp.]|uniref:GumC family protein n=1 Tax=Hyphomonas sp. TaxID=87 RepID=UPI0032EF6013
MPVSDAPNREPAGHGMMRVSASRPRLGTADLIVQFWRAKWLMLLVFVPVLALGLAAALSRPVQFESRARLMVAPAGAANNDMLVQPELAFLHSPVVIERVLDRFPMSRLYPEINAACETRRRAVRGDAERLRRLAAECRQLCIEAMERDFRASASSRAPVIAVRYRNEDAETSAEVLNALIGAYLAYRTQLLATPEAVAPEIDRTGLEMRLLEAETALGRFLETQQIGHLESERETVNALHQAARHDLQEAGSQLQQVESQLTAYRTQLKSIRPQQELFVEDSTAQTLLDLKLQREAMLVDHYPGSQEVQDMDRRIERVEAFIATLDGPVGTVRTGPNPRYEQILSMIDGLRAQAAALKDRQAGLAQQIAGLKARQAELASLAPRYGELMRKRDVLEGELLVAAGRGEVPGAQRPDGIKVLEPASLPVEPVPTQSIMAGLAFVLACLAALIAGLMKALTRTGFATRRSVERTLDLPVLATVREV